MAEPAPQVVPSPSADLPHESPAPVPPVTISPQAEEEKEKEKELKEAEEKKEKEKEAEEEKEKKENEKAAIDAAIPAAVPPEPSAGITRTFTTHAGETVTVAELPGAAKHVDVPATVPEAEYTVVTPQDRTEKDGPTKESIVVVLPPANVDTPTVATVNVPATTPEDKHIVIRERDVPEKELPISSIRPSATSPPVVITTEKSSREPLRPAMRKRSLTFAEESPTIDGRTRPVVIAPKAASIGTATIKSSPDLSLADSPTSLSKIDDDIGIFSQYVAKMDTALNVQIVFRTDGMTSQAFTDDRGTAMFTLDRKPSLLINKELRDKSRMFLLGIHKRRYRRPRQWYITTGTGSGIKVTSSWKRRNKNITFSFTNQIGGRPMKMLLQGGNLHLNCDQFSPVVAVIEPSRVRVTKGLDLTIACVACAVRNETLEERSCKTTGSLRSMKGSFVRRWGK